MTLLWFKKSGWVYIPSSGIGVLVTLLAVIFFVSVFIAVDRHSHSVSDTLYGVFPYLVSTTTILYWIASNTSNNK